MIRGAPSAPRTPFNSTIDTAARPAAVTSDGETTLATVSEVMLAPAAVLRAAGLATINDGHQQHYRQFRLGPGLHPRRFALHVDPGVWYTIQQAEPQTVTGRPTG